ncbi:hypothetical protein H4582DRAFT_1940796 [Lactarius indigo]|nr:hypothetical protein H4582DRAFT_1940796 [Lactarius indigo]
MRSSSLPSMASSEAYGSQPPTGNTPPAQEEHVVTTQIPAQPPTDPHTHHDPRTPSESIRASAELQKPNWLLSSRPSIPNKSAPSSSVGTNRRSISCSNLTRSCAPQHPPNTLETAQLPLHDASSSSSAPASPAPAGNRPPAERSGKRKAAEEPRRAAMGGRGPMFIDVDESSKIMRSSEESRAAALVKNQRRRVTDPGGEAYYPGYPKRARTACSPIATGTQRLTWRRKIGELPAASSSVSGIKGKGVCATSAASGVARTPRAAAAVANSNSCGPGLLGVVNQEVPSVPHDSSTGFSAPHGVAPPVKAAAPSQETARADAEPATMLPVSGDETAGETQPTTNAQADGMGGNFEFALPLTEALDSSGDPSDLTPQGGDLSDPMDDGSSSSSGVPLSLLVSPLRSARKRAFPAEEPLRSKKGKEKGKGKAKARASESKDEVTVHTDVSISLPRRKATAAATPRPSNSKGKSPKVKTTTDLSHIGGNKRDTSASPRKRLRAQSHHTSEEDTSDPDVVPQARIVRNNRPRTKSLWRVVEAPKNRARATQRLVAPSSRPRVWAGVRRRAKTSCWLRSPALAKNQDGVAWESLENPTLIFSGERGDPGLGWWDEDAWESRKIVFSIIRETDIPLADPPSQPFVSSTQDSTPDGGRTVADTLPPPDNPSNPQSDNDGTSAVVPNSKTSDSSSDQKDAGPPRIDIENLTDATPSQLIGPMDLPSSGFDRSSSILEPELRCDHDSSTRAGGQPAASSMPCGVDATLDACPPSGSPATEAVHVNGPPSFDARDPPRTVHVQTVPHLAGISPCDTESRGAEFFCSAPESTRERPIDHSPQAGLVCPSSSESAHPNASLPPCRAALDADADSVPSEKNIPFPRPPPEVAALLVAQSFGNVVTPVLARNSLLVPWELPSEIGYFWLGLFRISGVKVDTRLRRSTNPKALTGQRTWRFTLEWVPGGEDQLKDEDDREWSMRIMRPWWEPEHPQQPNQHPLSEPSQSAASPIPESWHDSRFSRLLLPLPLLAPFTENSTASGNFPVGYYCAVCGRINVQRFLRHRVCEGTACDSTTDPQRETGWVISAFSTRDRKLNSATVVPDDKWTAPTTAEPATAFDDGARLFHYHLAPRDSGPSAAPWNLLPSGNAGTVDVRHMFNGNRELLQGDASALFETLQRDVRIERSIGASAFVTPQIESGDDPALGRNGRCVWDQQAAFIEGALSTYCRDLGTLKVQALRVHAWISVGKHIQTFAPRAKHLVLLCLGADIAFLSVPLDPIAKLNGKPKKECLRVTMVHGDIVVLSGGQSKASAICMCMLLEAECN